MKKLCVIPFLGVFFFPFFSTIKAEEKIAVQDQTAVVQPTATPEASPVKKAKESQTNGKTLVIHRPRLSPSWGKVVQYKKEPILVLSEQNKEILHEFVLQDEAGVVRTAIFHESASGDGYWEVWVWDLP